MRVRLVASSALVSLLLAGTPARIDAQAVPSKAATAEHDVAYEAYANWIDRVRAVRFQAGSDGTCTQLAPLRKEARRLEQNVGKVFTVSRLAHAVRAALEQGVEGVAPHERAAWFEAKHDALREEFGGDEEVLHQRLAALELQREQIICLERADAELSVEYKQLVADLRKLTSIASVETIAVPWPLVNATLGAKSPIACAFGIAPGARHVNCTLEFRGRTAGAPLSWSLRAWRALWSATRDNTREAHELIALVTEAEQDGLFACSHAHLRLMELTATDQTTRACAARFASLEFRAVLDWAKEASNEGQRRLRELAPPTTLSTARPSALPAEVNAALGGLVSRLFPNRPSCDPLEIRRGALSAAAADEQTLRCEDALLPVTHEALELWRTFGDAYEAERPADAAWFARGALKRAEALHTQGRHVGEELFSILGKLADLSSRRDRLAEAIDYLQQRARHAHTAPRRVQAYGDIGRLLGQLGAHREAASAYEAAANAALSLRPASPLLVAENRAAVAVYQTRAAGLDSDKILQRALANLKRGLGARSRNLWLAKLYAALSDVAAHRGASRAQILALQWQALRSTPQAHPIEQAEQRVRLSRRLAEAGELERARRELRELAARPTLTGDAPHEDRCVPHNFASNVVQSRRRFQEALIDAVERKPDDARRALQGGIVCSDLALQAADQAPQMAELLRSMREQEDQLYTLALSADGAKFTALAFELILQRKGRVPEALAERSRQRRIGCSGARTDTQGNDVPAQLAGTLDQREAMLEYFAFDRSPVSGATPEPHYGVAIYRSNGARQLLDLGPTLRIDQEIFALRRALGSDRFDATLPAQRAYRRVFGPIAPYLTGVERLVVGPEGTLSLLPFTALHDGTAFLVDHYEVRYVTSGRELLPKEPCASKPARGVILVGDPKFSSGSLQPLSRTVSTLHAVDLPSLWAKLPPLPGTRRELGLIRKFVDDPHVLVDDAATEAELRALLKSHPLIVHIATHGVFQSNAHDRAGRLPGSRAALRPQESLAALALAMPKRKVRSPSDDGWLTDQELQEFDFSAVELVVLSACETGLGDLEQGQGVTGLRRAVLAGAGAHSLVSTLWQIDDHAAAQFMGDFYRRLSRGEGRARALHLSALAAKKRTPHPYFWAPFLLAGDSRPLKF
jgi:CHAT domain-containing protein